jgi:SAM-dependent methyltransferase
MSRKFVKSHKFSRVISADLSPNMLMETRQRCVKEGLSPPLLIRADAAKLPFADNSISAVHAGAAMHCWPRLPEALAEVHRVLKPGGKFFASTFFTTAFTAQPITGMTSQAGASSGMYMFSGESEILDLLRDAGFGVDEGAETERSGDGAIGAVATDTKATVRREGRGCAIVKAVK